MGISERQDRIDVSRLDYGERKPYKDGEIRTEALEYALKNYREIYIPAGKYYVDRSLIIGSDTKIIADENAEIILVKGTKTLLIRNESVIDGSFAAIADGAPFDRNITITGGVWGEENTERLGYGKTGCYDEADSFHGVSTCMLMSGVKGLTIENVTFRSTAGFACQVGRIEDFRIENLRFDRCFADGLHVGGGVRRGVIRNLYGHTEDDLVALNAYDWDDSSINFGPIEDLVVDGIKAAGGENVHKSFRIQPGVYPYPRGGAEDCYIKNLTVRNVTGVTTFKMYLQTPAYTDKPEKNVGVGRLENIIFENVTADTTSPVDCQPNYLGGDPITGNFATFEVGSNVRGLAFRDVRVSLDRQKYPNSYFMIAGPKSQYIAEKKLELFDPYVTCEVSGVTYDGVIINGENVNDLAPFVKEIVFDKLYPTDLPFGRGKITSITKEKQQ